MNTATKKLYLNVILENGEGTTYPIKVSSIWTESYYVLS